MGDDIGLKVALLHSEEQAEPVELPPVQDIEVVKGVEFIKFVQQDRARRMACIGPPEKHEALPLDQVWPQGSDVIK